MNIYIQGLGYRNPIFDKDQIIWYFEQTAKTKHKNHLTRYWLDLKESYFNSLLKMEAFELLDYIKNKSTTAQEKRREASRKKSKENAQKELEFWKNHCAERKWKRELVNQIGLN